MGNYITIDPNLQITVMWIWNTWMIISFKTVIAFDRKCSITKYLFEIRSKENLIVAEFVDSWRRSVKILTVKHAQQQVVGWKAFEETVLEAFTGNRNAEATRRVYSKESHKDGGHYYHLALKLGPSENGYL